MAKVLPIVKKRKRDKEVVLITPSMLKKQQKVPKVIFSFSFIFFFLLTLVLFFFEGEKEAEGNVAS